MGKKFKRIVVDEQTYDAVKGNARSADRTIAGEIRHMLVIISQPEQNFNQSRVGVMAKHADGSIEVRDTFVDPINQIEYRQDGQE